MHMYICYDAWRFDQHSFLFQLEPVRSLLNGFKTRIEQAFCFHQKHHIGQNRISNRFKNAPLLEIVRHARDRFLNGILTRENTFTSEKMWKQVKLLHFVFQIFFCFFICNAFCFFNVSFKRRNTYDVNENCRILKTPHPFAHPFVHTKCFHPLDLGRPILKETLAILSN